MVKCSQSCSIPEMHRTNGKMRARGGGLVATRKGYTCLGQPEGVLFYYKTTMYQGRIPGSGELVPQCPGLGAGLWPPCPSVLAMNPGSV